MRTHPFYAGDHVTHRDERICEFCGAPESAKVHELPEVPAEAQIIDSRKLGEAE